MTAVPAPAGLLQPLRCFVPGLPTGQGSVRAFIRGSRAVVVQGSSKGHRQSLDDWRHAIRTVVAAELPAGYEPIDGAVFLRATFGLVIAKSLPKRRRAEGPIGANSGDLDKLLRAVLDALTGVVWIDDSQVTRSLTEKNYSDRPGVDLYISQEGL